MIIIPKSDTTIMTTPSPLKKRERKTSSSQNAANGPYLVTPYKMTLSVASAALVYLWLLDPQRSLYISVSLSAAAAAAGRLSCSPLIHMEQLGVLFHPRDVSSMHRSMLYFYSH